MSVWGFELLGLWERFTEFTRHYCPSGRGSSIGANEPLNHSRRNHRKAEP